ncbi:mechanosensitive ion channel family protein [Parashewanella curva]|uniref:Small-conductance mechanosensitive channel n=1 Tax=Parashewanella curva TaxID=2338552 RepID=A0A3L8PRH2_9GAMM|nr:mechanosensitive ion channel domain-containing protein [Parashewanella curva]RLV58007.1 mechanosensitive ion channel family protein [Parashewanella curva]
MEKLLTWFDTNSHMIWDFGTEILAAIFILFIGYKLAKFLKKKVIKYNEKKGIDVAISMFLADIIFATIIVLSFITALANLGVQTSTFIAVIGASGLAIALALKNSLANLASGVLISVLRPFKAGHYIEAAGKAGTIRKIELFYTELNTPDNKIVLIPNSQIWGSPIVNYSRESTRRIDLVIGISYDSDLLKAKEMLVDIISYDARILKDPECKVAVSELADSSVNFIVRPWVNADDYWTVRSDLLETIKLKFDNAGISIPFPQMDVHLQGNRAIKNR